MTYAIESVVLQLVAEIPKKQYEDIKGHKIDLALEMVVAIDSTPHSQRADFAITEVVYEESRQLKRIFKCRAEKLPDVKEALEWFEPPKDNDADDECDEDEQPTRSPITRFMHEHEVGRGLAAAARAIYDGRKRRVLGFAGCRGCQV